MNTFNDIPVTAVGRQFVKIYYQTLYSDSRSLYKFYKPDATRTKASLHKDEYSESWVGIKEIKESYEKKGSGYKNVKIIAADFQRSVPGCILVTVSGTLMEDEDTALESINFVQVFVLASGGSQESWVIQNDVLRFDAIHHQKEENVPESDSNSERSLPIAAEPVEVNQTQETNEKLAENEESSENAKVEVENKEEENNKELSNPTSAENKEDFKDETINQETREAAEPQEQKEEQKTQNEEEQTKIVQQKQEQAIPQTESEQATPPQNKKHKFKKYENKSSPKSKTWGNRQQNSQQSNKSATTATPVPSAAPSTAPSTPAVPATLSYADIAKKIAAAGSLNPPPASSPAPVPSSVPASPAPVPSPSQDSSNSSENQSTPTTEPVTHKEQTKTQYQGKKEYKDSPNPFRKDPPTAGLNKTIVARNLPTTASKENLKTIFEEFGGVSNVHIVANSPLAFIEFSEPSSAQAVLLRAKTSAIIVEGKEIKVEPKKKRVNGPGPGGKERSNGGNVNNNNNSRKKEYRIRGNNNDSSNRGNN